MSYKKSHNNNIRGNEEIEIKYEIKITLFLAFSFIFYFFSFFSHSFLQTLTGGTILSRNKDYIVFYRGNDFLPPAVTEVLKERRKLRDIQQEEEEHVRQMAPAFIESKMKAYTDQLVAGTLAETKAATARWGSNPSSVDVEKMIKDSSLARHESIIRHLEKKLAIVSHKIISQFFSENFSVKPDFLSILIFGVAFNPGRS